MTATAATATPELVEAAAAGDGRAWSALVLRHGAMIRSVCRAHRLSDADADDVAQVTWMRAVEHIRRLEDPERFGAWLGTVARRECLRVLNAGARVIPTCEEPRAGAIEEPAGDEVAAERRAAVRGALCALPARQRSLLALLHSEAAPSYEAIGSTLDMPVGSIGPTRGRAIERLRRELRLVA